MPAGTPQRPEYMYACFPFIFAVLFRFAGDQWKANGNSNSFAVTFLY
jgi:hypothetical protein